MIDDASLDKAIVAAHQEASLPFKGRRTLEQQTATWAHQSGVRRALAEMWRALKAPKPSANSPSPEMAQRLREKIIARAEAEKPLDTTHLHIVPEDAAGRMLAALVGIREHARSTIEEIDANVAADGEHGHYTRERAKWQAVLHAIEVAEEA